MSPKSKGIYSRFIKRILDILISGVVLLLFWWVFVILALIVRVNLGAPVLFTQDRPGKDGKIFKLYKFRSMSNAKDKDGNLLPDKDRLSKFGKLLRSTSLDELPQRPFLVVHGNDHGQDETLRNVGHGA